MTQRFVFATWACNDNQEMRDYSRGSSRRPGEAPRKQKLKALGLKKCAERERGLLYVPCGSPSQKYILPITCHTKLSPSIPLQTTEVVKRPNISASLAACRHCCPSLRLRCVPTFQPPWGAHLTTEIGPPLLFHSMSQEQGEKIPYIQTQS